MNNRNSFLANVHIFSMKIIYNLFRQSYC